MIDRTLTKLLYLLLVVFVACSMVYEVMGVLAFYQSGVDGSTHVRTPFSTGDDDRTIDTLQPEAINAGLLKGDKIVAFDGRWYEGRNQWLKAMAGGSNALRPGDVLSMSTLREDGSVHLLHITLVERKRLSGSEALTAIAVQLMPPLLCLFIGYWVAFARPRDSNAWLLLVVLTLPEVTYIRPDWWPGAWLAFLGSWFMIFQSLGPLCLLLFGIYFPERWRFDIRFPFLKWFVIVPTALGFACLTYVQTMQSFFASDAGPILGTISRWTANILDPLSLFCVVAYCIAILDKLHSATTADGRRRMRVICAGSLVGLGSLLLVFVLIPHIFETSERLEPVRIIGAVLILALPLSLAYVVVVQRALDVRILLRIGTRYALARATIVILELAIGLFVVIRFLLPLLQKRSDLTIAVPIVIVVVASIFQLFSARNGVSKRLQAWLDRKFFREAYNAEIVLSELSEQARGFTETGPLIDTISRRISEVLHVEEVSVFLRGGNVFRMQQAVGVPIQSHLVFDERSSTIRNLMRSNQPATLYRENPDGWFLLADEDERKTLETLGAEVLLPLSGRDRLLGVLTLGSKRSEEAYSPTDLRLLQSVGNQTGLALEISELVQTLASQAASRERMDRELEIAREVQERLFPQATPVFPDLTLAGCCRPAQGIGGDYYDFIVMETAGRENGLLGLAIGDISGKGISAALLMASLRASLRGVTMEAASDLARVMHKVNRLVYEASATNRYATFFFAIYDGATRIMRYVNAGHNLPVLLRGSKTIFLDGGGPVVGLLPDAFYQEQEIQLQPGDLFLGYTDGISEAMTRKEEEWGEDRMIAAAIRARAGNADAIMKNIFAEADDFTAGASQHDDMTLLLMKLEASAI